MLNEGHDFGVIPGFSLRWIIRGREEYGGGWLCYKNKGGCGAKFDVNDPAITAQQVGRVINPDIPDQINTIQKMAQKRALIGTTLLAVNASEFFTQDIEDFNHEPTPSGTDGGRPAPATTGRAPDPNPRKATPTPPVANSVAELATPKQVTMIRGMAHELDIDPDARSVRSCSKRHVTVEQLSRKGASSMIDHLKAIIAGTEDVASITRRAGSVQDAPKHVRYSRCARHSGRGSAAASAHEARGRSEPTCRNPNNHGPRRVQSEAGRRKAQIYRAGAIGKSCRNS